jgi:hypothetical protein
LKLHDGERCARLFISEGDRFPLKPKDYFTVMKITVDGLTHLESKGDKGGVTKFAEFYANWETGNYFEVPKGTEDAKVVEAYKAQFVTA